MCEIAILNPRRFTNEELTGYAEEIYQSQRTALGIVAAYDTEGQFEYETYRSTDPEFDDIESFIDENAGCFRFFIHGRLATSGERDIVGAHPIEIECERCGVDYIIHNGILRQEYRTREALDNLGHDFTTNVDTEVIAHLYGGVPETWDEEETALDQHRGVGTQPGFVLFNDERIYIRCREYSYELDENCEMYRPRRRFANDTYEGDIFQAMIIRPNTEAPTEETEAPEATV